MASSGEVSYQSNSNETKHTISVGKNNFCLEIGSIINTKANLIRISY